ncbi:hypothetical protein A2U01_0072930, partial [Trifolium medium]|nr:hypothetical protein [Trifolium medium]
MKSASITKVKKVQNLANESTANTEPDPRANNPPEQAAGIKALSSKLIREQPQGHRRIKVRYRSRGNPDALRPADLNRPGTSE